MIPFAPGFFKPVVGCSETFAYLPSLTEYGTAEAGQPSVSGGQMTFLSADSLNWSAAFNDCPPRAANFQLEFTHRLHKTNADSGGQYMQSGVWFRTTTPASDTNMSFAGCYVLFDRIVDGIGGNFVTLKGRGIGNVDTSALAVSTETTYKIVAVGASLELYANGSLLLSTTDNDPTVGTYIGIWQRSALVSGRICYIKDLSFLPR